MVQPVLPESVPQTGLNRSGETTVLCVPKNADAAPTLSNPRFSPAQQWPSPQQAPRQRRSSRPFPAGFWTFSGCTVDCPRQTGTGFYRPRKRGRASPERPCAARTAKSRRDGESPLYRLVEEQLTFPSVIPAVPLCFRRAVSLRSARRVPHGPLSSSTKGHGETYPETLDSRGICLPRDRMRPEWCRIRPAPARSGTTPGLEHRESCPSPLPSGPTRATISPSPESESLFVCSTCQAHRAVALCEGRHPSIPASGRPKGDR